MPALSLPTTRRELGPSAMAAPERRLHKRYPLTLVGRFMRADRLEYACELIDISVGGLALYAPAQPEIGESIIVYIDELGGLEGKVARNFEGGFAISLTATQQKREKLAAKITWLVNREEFDGTDTRAHERTLPGRNTNTLKLSEDVALQVQIIDVSLSGANVVTEARPPLGSEVWLGRLRAEVVRHHARGIGISFIPVQEPDVLQQTFG